MGQNNFPAGWNEERVRDVLVHYENQTEEEAVMEDENAFADSDKTTMPVPHELVPVVRALIAHYEHVNPEKLPEARLTTALAIFRHGQIELVEKANLPEGAKLLVTFFSKGEAEFWLGVSQTSLNAIWDNQEDDVYAERLGA